MDTSAPPDPDQPRPRSSWRGRSRRCSSSRLSRCPSTSLRPRPRWTSRTGGALEILERAYAEGSSGIVLERVAGGYAFRASREASEACARLFESPAERGLSQAALETLAIVAYLGPVSRPEIAHIRGVNVDGVVAGLVERGLIAEGGRDNEFGAIRYRTTPLFERIFGLESLAALPRLDDLGADIDEIRGRLEAVAEKRPA